MSRPDQFVARGWCSCRRAPVQHLRVIVTSPEHRHPNNVIRSLAHELQHAREVIQAAAGRDAGAVRDVFERIARISVESAGVVTYEMYRAVEVGDLVWRELQNNAAQRAR